MRGRGSRGGRAGTKAEGVKTKEGDHPCVPAAGRPSLRSDPSSRRFAPRVPGCSGTGARVERNTQLTVCARSGASGVCGRGPGGSAQRRARYGALLPSFRAISTSLAARVFEVYTLVSEHVRHEKEFSSWCARRLDAISGSWSLTSRSRNRMERKAVTVAMRLCRLWPPRADGGDGSQARGDALRRPRADVWSKRRPAAAHRCHARAATSAGADVQGGRREGRPSTRPRRSRRRRSTAAQQAPGVP